MNKKYTNTRITALVSALIFVMSIVLTGCSVGKITPKEVDTSDGKIQIGEGDGSDVTGESQIVIGSDGQSYLVDAEGNSIVYDATSSYIINGTTVATTTKKTTTTKRAPSNNNSNNNTPNNKTTSTATVPTVTTTNVQSEVFNALAAQRKFGFNAAYDKYSGLANFYLDTIRAYFEYNNKYWLVEFWKGEYAMAAVGCEIGLYYAEKNTANNNLMATLGPDHIHYASVKDEDAMYMTMELYHYQHEGDETPKKVLNFNRNLCWWAASFQTGVLEKHSDRTALVMIGSVEFPTNAMRDLFVEQMELKGFKEGDTSSYKNVERYSVSGKKVTVVWRYFAED